MWELSKIFFRSNFPVIIIVNFRNIVFFNFTTPEFNVYVCQLPIKAAAVYFFWKGLNYSKLYHWVLTGIFALGNLATILSLS